MLRVEDLSKTYVRNDVHALDRINLTVKDGQFVSIIGASGCGKSTLLKIMAGLIPPSSGRVLLDGTPVLGPRPDIGMMFQQATLLPWRTALENVLLPIEIRDGAKAAHARSDLAVELLGLVGLAGFEKAYPGELSGGMAQRVAICRMLIIEPSVLLLDEPFGALDELTRERMNEELQRICTERQATAFMVTHSIAEAVFLGDALFVMSARPGRIVEVVPIDIPRPREFSVTTEPHFGEIVQHVRSRLDLGEQL
ncbi:MAG: ATP-binding cassette domain-containing protein [Propionibacteriales bacterium]|nr:ATP-binding cassette domain-containing protein [Propionibacteriales bacterium]